MRSVSENTRISEIAPGLFANVDDVALPDMDAKGIEYVSQVIWLTNADGERIGDFICRCNTTDCSISKSCENGDYDCNCEGCYMTCT